MAQAFIKLDGVSFPYPKRGLSIEIATVVDSARNANGVIVSQRVGRDQQKINECVWPHLSAQQWSSMLKIFERFTFAVEYPDMATNKWTKRKMYCGNRSAEIFKLDKNTGLPLEYINCTCNLIDCGE